MEERILTDEMREKLLGDLPFSASATMEYIPKHFSKKDESDKDIIPKEFQAVFALRGMTKPEKKEAKKYITHIKDKGEKTADGIIEITRKCIMEWKNVFDLGTKKEIEYKADPEGGADKEMFDRLPEAVISDLFIYLSKISGLLDTTMLGLKS